MPAKQWHKPKNRLFVLVTVFFFGVSVRATVEPSFKILVLSCLSMKSFETFLGVYDVNYLNRSLFKYREKCLV